MAKEAWDLIAKIFNDNKRTRSIALKAKLRSLKLCDLSIDAYFRKIEFIATILTSLRSYSSNDDMVTIALKGLPDKYDNVSGIIAHREPFSDLKTVHSMLTIEEMKLKSRAQATSIDSSSSSPMVLLTNSDNSTRCSNIALEKVNKPCFNFNKGFCHFCEHCKLLHNGVHGNPSLWSISNTRSTTSLTTPNMTPQQMIDLIQSQQALLAKFRCIGNVTIGRSNLQGGHTPNLQPVALHATNIRPAQFSPPQGFPSQQFGPPQFLHQHA
ncbi:hybrid signal transduction histidine kinase M [Tanacetum coccineum]